MSIYDDLIEYFNDEKRGWCQGTMFDGQSACLVGGVMAVTRAAYGRKTGTPFESKDEKKWKRAEKVLAHLHEVQFPDLPDHVSTLLAIRDYSGGAEALTAFNDRTDLTEAERRRLVAAAVKAEAYADAQTERSGAVWHVAYAEALEPVEEKVNLAAAARQKKKVLALIAKTGKQFPND